MKLLPPGKRRNRKVELGGLQEEYLGRRKSREKAPGLERSWHHQKTAVHSALSRVLGERRAVRVWPSLEHESFLCLNASWGTQFRRHL